MPESDENIFFLYLTVMITFLATPESDENIFKGSLPGIGAKENILYYSIVLEVAQRKSSFAAWKYKIVQNPSIPLSSGAQHCTQSSLPRSVEKHKLVLVSAKFSSA